MLDKIKRCYIIAEIGGNFKTYKQAVALIDAAKDCKVDCIKLQTYKAKTLVTKGAFFEMENTGRISQYEYFEKFELPVQLQRDIFEYIDSIGLDWFSTPSHREDVDFLFSSGIKAFKIGSDDALNFPLLKYIAKKGLPIFLSTGMCNLEEVKDSVNAILSAGNRNISILHTVSAYPAYPEYINLKAIKTLQSTFPSFIIGFSDHSLSSLASLCAVALGAKVIERHFTLDKKAKGPDHLLSSDPQEMKYLVESIRTVEKMLGNGIKVPLGPEIKNRLNNRKSIVANTNIKKGEIFTLSNIDIKRPGKGIAPKFLGKIIGKNASRDIKEDTLISWRDVYK